MEQSQNQKRRISQQRLNAIAIMWLVLFIVFVPIHLPRALQGVWQSVLFVACFTLMLVAWGYVALKNFHNSGDQKRDST